MKSATATECLTNGIRVMSIQIAKAVLKMPTKIGDKIICVQKIQQQLTGNTYFPTAETKTPLLILPDRTQAHPPPDK